jgi:hypothetical protein
VWCFVDSQMEAHAALPFTPKTSVDDAIFRSKQQALELIPATEEYAATIAASLGRYYLRRGRAFALVTGGQAVDIIPPDRGARQFGKVLESLALWKADAELPFGALVAGQARHLPRGSTVVLVTPSPSRDISVAVDQLMRLGLRPVVVLLDAATFGAEWTIDDQEISLRGLGVPLTRIAKDDNIGVSLSLTGVWGTEMRLPQMRATELI